MSKTKQFLASFVSGMHPLFRVEQVGAVLSFGIWLLEELPGHIVYGTGCGRSFVRSFVGFSGQKLPVELQAMDLPKA